MVKDGNPLAPCRRYFVTGSLEIDGGIGVDSAGTTQGKMQVEQGRVRGRPEARATSLQLFQPDLGRDAPGRAQEGVILALDFHLQNFVCRLERSDFCVCQEGDEPVLKSVETPLDLALGLRGWGDQMGDSEP